MLNVYKYEGFGKHFQKLRDLRTRRKWAKQRAKRGFCDRDLWAIDTWFIEIMPEMLEALADRATGYPNRLWDDYYETHKDEFAIPEDTPPKKLRALGVSHYLKNEDDCDRIEKICAAEWDRTLRSMARLFREANPETCSLVNPFKDEYHRAWEEFKEKYGRGGEKLRTPEEIELDEREQSMHVHTMLEVPEYRDISERSHAEEEKIDEYRERALHEALEMFVEYFSDLWD